MNKAILIGRLTKDPEMNTTSTGIDVCRFTIAINRTYKDANGNEQTDFIPIVVWRNQAANCGKYLTKGSQCAVTGTIQTRSYEKDGEKKYVTEVVADNVEFLAKPQNSGTSDGYGYNKKPEKIDDLTPLEDDSQLPF
ncbi:MAG: single-stranded DNA-binding protein [Clostridia bacterium]|nr:single-stranded DNA-binding protein [Clostridia bacterium]